MPVRFFRDDGLQATLEALFFACGMMQIAEMALDPMRGADEVKVIFRTVVGQLRDIEEMSHGAHRLGGLQNHGLADGKLRVLPGLEDDDAQPMPRQDGSQRRAGNPRTDDGNIVMGRGGHGWILELLIGEFAVEWGMGFWLPFNVSDFCCHRKGSGLHRAVKVPPIRHHILYAPTAPSPPAVEGWGGVLCRHRPGKQQPIWVLRPGYFFVILGRLSGHEGDGTEICDDGRDVAPIPLVPVRFFVIFGRLSGHEGDGTEICDNGRDVAPIPLVPVRFFVIFGRLSGHEGDGTEICDDGRDVAPIPLVPVRFFVIFGRLSGHEGDGTEICDNGRDVAPIPLVPVRFFVIFGRLSGHEGDGTEICDNGRDVAPIPLVPVPIGPMYLLSHKSFQCIDDLR